MPSPLNLINMPTKILQIELLENNLFVELEAEETMPFSIIVAKLKTENHLKTDGTYYVKTTSGMPVKETSAISIFRQNSFVITENPDWKSPEIISSNLAEVPQVTGDMVMNDNKYWVLPFCNGISWDNDEFQSHLFCLNNVIDASGKKLSLNIVVQYSLIETTLSGSRHIHDRAIKMRQILEDAFNVELVVNNINENNFYDHRDKLTGKMHYYLNSHMEAKWGTKIERVSITGFREYPAA